MDLYRGKEKQTGEWIVGAVICIDDKAYALGSESLFPERPAYNRLDMGFQIGYSDNVRDRQDAAVFGWTKALEKYEENFPIWLELDPETVTRCCGRHDENNNVLFEGDIFESDGELFEICFGEYISYFTTRITAQNVGFFTTPVVRSGITPKNFSQYAAPLGDTERDCRLVGNIFDNPELIQAAAQEAGQDAAQPLLQPAT